MTALWRYFDYIIKKGKIKMPHLITKIKIMPLIIRKDWKVEKAQDNEKIKKAPRPRILKLK